MEKRSSEPTILDGLNNEQMEAVAHQEGPLLIIAGAGTGKTTVVTRRIAHLIQEGEVHAHEILALTFTEKAAGEMEERVDSLLPLGYLDLWISTFHAFCDRILREHALDIGLSNDYRLLSDTEQWLLLREQMEEIELDYYKPKGNPTKFVQALISHFSRLKDEDITPEQYMEYAEGLRLDTDSDVKTSKKGLSDEQKDAVEEAQRVMEVASAYAYYQQLLRDKNAMDFGDLIVETIHLFQQRPALLELYRQQFKYILVDEFQDTNYAQYELIKLLSAPTNNLTVVADDDQSIYSFRGASMSNILTFKKDFPDSKEISLVQNYRSRQAILDLAYEFIQNNNPNRLEKTLDIEKKLQSNNEGEATIEHLYSQSLEGEAKLVLDRIKELKAGDDELTWSDFAILVRANDSAKTFIPYLERSNIPYQFLASQGLFTKPIIMDLIAFLKLLDSYHESRAMYRVLSYDLWGVPPEQIMDIMQYSNKHTQSLYETCSSIREVPGLTSDTYESIESLLTLISAMTEMARRRTVGEVVLTLMEQSGYLKKVAGLPDEEASEQLLYLNQFYKYIESFERSQEERSVQLFVQELNLMIESGEQGRLQPDFDEGPESVKIMTVHGSKGLEFEHVFIVNMVDKRFPAIGRREAIPVPDALVKDIIPDGDWHLEEERRLFYVAMTRAKKGLYLTSGEDYGGARKKKPSRFLVEAGFAETVPQPTGEVLFTDSAPLPIEQQQAERSFIPSSFSFTQLKAYETCPWQYRFAFLLKVPAQGKPSFSFGKSMHATLYEFFRRMKEGSDLEQGGLFEHTDEKPLVAPTLKDLLEIYDEKWIAEWFYSKKQQEEYYKKGKDSLKAFYELHEKNWPSAAHLEEGFTLSLAGTKIKGAIDRVDNADEGDGVHIIDYKTGKFPKNGKKDTEQLYLYAMAVQEIFQRQPLTLSYYFLEDNKSVVEEVDLEKMEKVRIWATTIIEQIKEGEFKPTPGFHCKYCDYYDICEYRAK